jgi:mannonate dehydratase
MKLGLGLYKHMLTKENYAFARQAGATHIVIHMVDYFNQGGSNTEDNQPTGDSSGWGPAGNRDVLWSLEDLLRIKAYINDAGLELEAVENFDPAHWYDVLLDGPRREEQLENLKTIIRMIGKAQIPIFGYNFSLAGVCGRITGPFARGGAMSVGMDGVDDSPIPNGMVWNMIYDSNAQPGTLPEISHEQLWARYTRFLNELLPVAQQANVRFALHPDDPPVPYMRRQPRLVYQPSMYERVIEINSSPFNQFELCIGTLAEMTEGDVYQVIDRYSKSQRIAYIHIRNIRGKVPNYYETFVDEGDLDMRRIIRILQKNDYKGMLIPDHTPQMNCSAPWHAGMAYALGYIKGIVDSLVCEDN